MKQTSQEYQKKIKTSGRHFQAKLLIEDKTFRDFSDFKITSSVNAEDALTIGNCISSLLECKLLNVQDMSLFQGKQCKAYLGLALDTKEYEWILMGTYTIAEVNKEDVLYHIKAYDAFYLSEKGFFSELVGMQTISAILEEQCKKMGIAYAGGDDGASVDVQQLEGKSIREAIGLLASYCGKNAVIDPQGELCLKWYQESNVVLDASRFRDPLDIHDGNTYISSMKCAIDKDIIYTTESGLGIEFSNPLMSQKRLEQLFQPIKGFTYRAGKVELQMGQPELDAGDIVTIEDKRGERYRFAIMSITYQFDGGCYCQLEAKAKTETSAQFSFQGTLSSKIDNVHTDLTTTKQLVADTINAFEGKFETIDTNNLQVNERLRANEGEIETLKSNTITSEVLDSKLAIIDQAMIGKADVTQLNALRGTVDVLDTKVGTIDTIVSHVTTSDSSHSLLINAQTAVVDEGYFKALAADTIGVNDLKAGEISTTKFHLTSDEGNLTLNDNTMQIKDAKRVRVQIGKDASGDYGLYQWDASGNLTWDSNGLTKDGIKQPIIVDEMISDTAQIDGKKLNIASVVSSINDGTSTIEASHILYDGKALDVAFGTMSTSVSSIDQTLKNQEPLWNQGVETATSALKQAEAAQMAADSKARIFAAQPVPPYRIGDLWVQGKDGMILRCVSARINGDYNASDWEKADAYSDDTKALEVEGKVSEVKEIVQGHSTQLSAQDGKIATLITDTTQVKKDLSLIQGEVSTAQGSITQLQSKYSSLQQSVDGISSTVGEHSSSISTITKIADAAENTANNALTMANSKAKIFIAQPAPPYQVGDLWVAGSGGEIKRCKTARASGTYSAEDWEKADKYTDDTKANAVDARVTSEIKTVSEKQSSLQQSVDQISTKVSASETTMTTITDLINSNKDNWDQAATALTTANSAKTTADTAKSTADSAKTTADNAKSLATSKSKIFNAQPIPPYQVGDLWVPGAGGEIKRCKTARASGSYTATDWEKADKYTDDTKANAVDARVTTEIKSVTSKQTALEQNINGFKATVSSTYSTKVETQDQINNSIIQVSEGYNSSIEATKSAILQSVSADYTLQSDTDALSQHVDTVISQTAKDIEFRFNTAQELLNQLDGKVDGNKQEIQKFIRFIEGKIELGQSNSKFSLTISNDRISFKDNGAEVAYISNSTLYITDADVTNSLRIGQFAFVPRANGNMSIKLMK